MSNKIITDYEIRQDIETDGTPAWDVYAQYDGDSDFLETFSSREEALEYIATLRQAAESMVATFIENDEQNNLFDIYEREMGEDPVPEEGGHTEDFENWFVSQVGEAVLSGCKTVQSVIEFIKNN